MAPQTFRDRHDAAKQLAEELKKLDLHDPVVLGIPRGGVVMAAAIAEQIGADMDVVLVRKLRHPAQPELAIGSVTEEGEMHLNEAARSGGGINDDYLERERQDRFEELQNRRKMFRDIRPAVGLEGRSVIVTDDGIATGSTMLAALPVIHAQKPREVIVAVPVAPPDRLQPFRDQSDRVVCLQTPSRFMAIGQFYDNFQQVDDDQACATLRQFAPTS